MIRSEIVTSVRGLLDDDAYDEDEITQAANWFQNELFNDTRTRIMETSEELFLSTGDYEVELPDDMQTLLNVSVTSPTPARRILESYMAYNTFINAHPGFASASVRPAANNDWTDFGNMMRFAAPVSAATTIYCEYLRRPVPMEEDDDECEIPSAYDELTVRGTLARIMERNEDYAEASQERGNMEPLVTTFKRNEGRGQMKIGPNIMGTRRGRVGGYRADRDF